MARERKSLMGNVSGTALLIEQCPKISVFEVVQEAKEQLLPTIARNIANVAGYEIEFTTSRLAHGGERLWFKCPQCDGRKGVLYSNPLNGSVGCKDCLGLEYKSRRYRNMVENTI